MRSRRLGRCCRRRGSDRDRVQRGYGPRAPGVVACRREIHGGRVAGALTREEAVATGSVSKTRITRFARDGVEASMAAASCVGTAGGGAAPSLPAHARAGTRYLVARHGPSRRVRAAHRAGERDGPPRDPAGVARPAAGRARAVLSPLFRPAVLPPVRGRACAPITPPVRGGRRVGAPPFLYNHARAAAPARPSSQRCNPRSEMSPRCLDTPSPLLGLAVLTAFAPVVPATLAAERAPPAPPSSSTPTSATTSTTPGRSSCS